MVPNHLFQLLSLVAMEPPARFDAHTCAPARPRCWPRSRTQSEADALQNSVRGQYRAAASQIRPWRTTQDAARRARHTTETYVALKLAIDNWRWAGVPFYLRTGKTLGAKRTEVAIKFKEARSRCSAASR